MAKAFLKIIRRFMKILKHVIYSIGYVLLIESRNRYDYIDCNTEE